MPLLKHPACYFEEMAIGTKTKHAITSKDRSLANVKIGQNQSLQLMDETNMDGMATK